MKRNVITAFAILVLLFGILPSGAGAFRSASHGAVDLPDAAAKPDNLPHPLGTQQAALKQQALDAKLNGKAYGRTTKLPAASMSNLNEPVKTRFLRSWVSLAISRTTILPNLIGLLTTPPTGCQISASLIIKICFSRMPQAQIRCGTSTSSNHPTVMPLTVL